MDDTTQSKSSDVAASAATRKRRSSILKSQRPPRTPFCELEFNACTPTDTTKSRRVSFSKRTGVAEFVTNEATTTWKNFYEEHNKSLESSGNDSEMNHGKQHVVHLGKRIFDQQFEEVEAVDFMGTLNHGNISSSINNINFAESECTEVKLTAPQSNFELSALTETQTKLFGDNLAITCTGEDSGRVDINFSTTQQIGENDDLDEIQKDLQRHSNIVSQGPFTEHNLSEYIEVDLNMTHIAISKDESDMSITDTVHIPKVQNVSKSCLIDKNISINNKDWVTDKENIVLNPYVAPRESINFVVTEIPDEVLVFDGKRLIVETEKPKKENRQSVLPKPSDRVPQRKTIVLNCNDDLPNFLEEAQASRNQSCFIGVSQMQQSCILEDKPAHHRLDEMQSKHRTVFGDDLDDISVSNVIAAVESRRVTVYDDEIENISITQALPTNIIDKEKRRTIMFENDNANVSITQAVSSKLIIPNENIEKTKTIVFENEACNISMTQAIPTHIIPANTAARQRTICLESGTANVSISQSIPTTIKESKESRRTVLYQDNTENISVTHCITSSRSNDNVRAQERRTTIVFENDIGNISVTQALPSNIILPEKINATTIDDANISMTQALPANIVFGNNIEPNRRRTVLYEDDTGNLSITQGVTKNQLIQGLAHQQHQIVEPSDTELATNRMFDVNNDKYYNAGKSFDGNSEDGLKAFSINQVQEKLSDPAEKTIENKRQTIVFQNDAADLSITQAVPIRQVIDDINAYQQNNIINIEAIHKDNNSANRRTVIFENDALDISLTQAVPMNRVIDTVNEQIQSGFRNNQAAKDLKIEASISKNNITQITDSIQKGNYNIEATNLNLDKETTNKRRTVVFDNEDADISMTQAVPMNKVFDAIKGQNFNFEATNEALHKEEISNALRTVVYENDDADISMTQVVAINQIIDTIQKENQKFEAINAPLHKEESSSKRRTVVFENDEADLSTTHAVRMNQVIDTYKKDQNFEATNTTVNQGLNRRKTIVGNDEVDIPTAQLVSLNEVLDRGNDGPKYNITQNEPEIDKNETLHYGNATNNKTLPNVYNFDEGDISMTRAISYSILPDGQEKKRPIVVKSVESLLENKDLLMEIDRLSDDTNENKSSGKVSDEDFDISMTDLSDLEIIEKKIIANDGNDVCITKTIRESFGPNKQDISRTVKIEEQTTLSKPIPAALATLQQERIDKSHCKDLTKHDGLLPNALSDVLVYQSLTTDTQNLIIKTDKGDSQITTEEEKASAEETKDSKQSLAKLSSEVKIPENERIAAQSVSNNELVSETTSKHSAVKTVDSKPKNSVLNDLLDMSQSSLECTEDKVLMPQISSVHEAPQNIKQADTKNSMDTMFYITKDNDEERAIDKSETTSNTQETAQIQDGSPLSIEYKDDEDAPIVRDIQTKLSTKKNVLREDHIPQFKTNQHETLDEHTGSKVSQDMSQRKSIKSIKMANDTTELLEMLSDLTDKRLSRNVPMEELKENDEIPESRSLFKNQVELSKPEPTRFNRTLKRQSMVLSREDLLNNLSMASAMLQKSRSDFDESESNEEVDETPNISKEHKRSIRLSTDVVKTLQFDDDSINEKNESAVQTPLKKTAFGEISYIKETKSRVIPGFNITDGIKELMDDLVKPMSDTQPFTKTTLKKNIKKNPSTCSTQIQANLLTTSQVDLHTDLYSTTDSLCEMNKLSSVDIISDAVNRSMSRALNSPEKSISVFTQSAKSSEMDVKLEDTDGNSVKTTIQTKPVSSSRPLGNVLIFDQHNPLNNVLLVPTPPHAIDIHRYDPLKPDEDPQPSRSDETENEEVINQFRVEVPTPVNKKHVHKTETQSVTSNTSKPKSIDQYTEPETSNFRDVEINTVIVMKGNEKLLEASSSLTLVDDELNRNNSYSRTTTSKMDCADSPLKVIYKVEAPPLTKTESDFTSTEDIEQSQKPKKRIYSPANRDKYKQSTLSSLDVTPKPIIKMQKRSMTPDNGVLTNLRAERDKSNDQVNREKSPVRQKSPRNIKSKKPGTMITVQQLMTMVHVEPNQEEKGQIQPATVQTDSSTTEPRSNGSHEVLEVVTSSEIMSSFTSSNNLRDETSIGGSSISRDPSKVRWLPMSTSHLMMDSAGSDDDVDIVGMIDAMPCMGSHDCEWESAAGSVWSMLLLHARLRLIVRFAAAPRLRLDTPVLNIELETLHQDKKNPIAYLCVVFAGAMMRQYMSRGCAAAGDVCKLVRQLSGAARLAAQWARAMQHARARLAYSLTHEGWLALKVANVSFRTVWEVTMRLELVVEHARATPWPRACSVRVTRVLASGGAAPPDVSRVTAATPGDWGHAPRTIWKVFRYLKHKKREEDAVHF